MTKCVTPKLVILTGALLAFASPVYGQTPPPDPEASQGGAVAAAVTLAQSPFAQPSVTPRGAFIRSLLIPGWGHVAAGSIGRGGFYFGAQMGSLWALWKSAAGRREAERLGGVERSIVEARLIHSGMMDPDSILMRIDADPEVRRWDELIEARSQQVEDWAALSIGLVLIGAVDALVAAHLMDYPAPLSFDLFPGRRGGVELRMSVPFSASIP